MIKLAKNFPLSVKTNKPRRLPQVTSLEAISQTSHSCPWSQKRLRTAFFYFLFTYAVVLPNTSKHTLMCKISHSLLNIIEKRHLHSAFRRYKNYELN